MVMSRNSSFYKDSWWSINDGIFFFHNRGYNRLKSTEGFDGSEIDPLAECDELQCKPGWDGDPYDCEDVDECVENLHEVVISFKMVEKMILSRYGWAFLDSTVELIGGHTLNFGFFLVSGPDP